jgi:hypothetical protein
MLQNLSLEAQRVIPEVRHNSGILLQLTKCVFPNDLGDHQLALVTSGHPRDKQLNRLEKIKDNTQPRGWQMLGC